MSYIGNTNTNQAFTPQIDYFSGNGSTTSFTLSRNVLSVYQVEVFVENIPQNPSSAFTVSGNTITFTGAPPSGSNNVYVRYTSPVTQFIQPGQGTVTPTTMSDGAPTWSPTAGVSLPRISSTTEGGQLNFNRASDNTGNWSIDSYGSSSTPSLRFIDDVNVRMALDGNGNVGIGTASPATKLDVVGDALIGPSSSKLYLRNLSSTNRIDSYNYPITATYPLQINASTIGFSTVDTERMRIDSSGRVTMPYQVSFNAYTTTTFNNAAQVITFTGTNHNIGSAFNTSTSRFTAPIAGRYLITAGVAYASAGYYDIVIRKNGVDLNNAQFGQNGGGTGYPQSSLTQVVQLTANDYLEMYMIGASGGNSRNTYTWFTGELLG